MTHLTSLFRAEVVDGCPLRIIMLCFCPPREFFFLKEASLLPLKGWTFWRVLALIVVGQWSWVLYLTTSDMERPFLSSIIFTPVTQTLQWNGPDSWFIYFRSGDLITTILNLTYVMLTCDLSISTFSIITSMLTCHLLMSICNISMSTCNIIMPICQMILLTCNLNYNAYWQNKSHVNIIILHVNIIYHESMPQYKCIMMKLNSLQGTFLKYYVTSYWEHKDHKWFLGRYLNTI